MQYNIFILIIFFELIFIKYKFFITFTLLQWDDYSTICYRYLKFCAARIRNFHSFFQPIIVCVSPMTGSNDNLPAKEFIMSTERNGNGLYSVSRATIRYKIANDFNTAPP